MEVIKEVSLFTNEINIKVHVRLVSIIINHSNVQSLMLLTIEIESDLVKSMIGIPGVYPHVISASKCSYPCACTKTVMTFYDKRHCSITELKFEFNKC